MNVRTGRSSRRTWLLLAWFGSAAAAACDETTPTSYPDAAPDAEDVADLADVAPPESETTPETEDTGEEDAGPALRFVAVRGDRGDVPFEFELRPPDAAARTIHLAYRGGCAGADWHRAAAGGLDAPLGPGVHSAVWWSWEHEAGCSGTVRLALVTDRAETAESEDFVLANTGPDSGFIDLPRADQGIDPDELDLYERAVTALVADPAVDFVATRRDDHYEVYAARGVVAFARQPTHAGYRYDVLAVEGVNPIERQDPTWLPTLEDQLAAGHNPHHVELTDLGYGPGDWRVSFLEPEDDSYPFGYERIAAYFDHPDAGDLLVNPVGYAHRGGEHGSLNVLQSRCPLLLWGAGIRPGVFDTPARQVDVAPTVAALLGLPTVEGVDERGVWSRFVRLRWQDGHELAEALDGTGAEFAILVVSDGLTHAELLDELETNAAGLPNLSRLQREGAWFRYGSVTNWPSNTYPSHNVIGAGVWSGHHGLVDNRYLLRDRGVVATPIADTFGTERYFAPVHGPAETLHMAVHRGLGWWEPGVPGGAYTASLYDPSVKEADTADLERRDRSGRVPFPPLGLYWPSEIPGPDPWIGDTTVSAEQLVEQIGMVELYHLFTNGVSPPPRWVIMNFPTTDGAGHARGPHSDLLRQVLMHIDRQIGVLLGWLERWDLLGRVALIFTSDHGMQLGDPSRAGDPLAALDAAGIERVPGTGNAVYFR